MKKTISNEIWIKAAVKEAVRVSGSEKTFWEALKEIFERNNTNAKDFEARTLLDKRSTYYRYLNENERPKNIKVPTIVAIAVGYELTPHETEELMKLAGLSFIPNNKDHAVYKFILNFLHGLDVHECNKVLDIAEVERLGSRSRED